MNLVHQHLVHLRHTGIVHHREGRQRRPLNAHACRTPGMPGADELVCVPVGRPGRTGNCQGPRGRIRVMLGSPAR